MKLLYGQHRLDATPMKCQSCGRTKSPMHFYPGYKICKECKRARARLVAAGKEPK